MTASDLKNTERPSLSEEVRRFSDKLKEVIGDASVRGFAGRCGLSDAVLRSYLRGDTYPTLDRLDAIAAAAGVPISFFTNNSNQVQEPTDNYGHECDFALVPRYNVQASAGPGSEVHSEQIVDHLAFKRSWLTEMDLKAGSLALITAKGDSMVPTIKDGSLLLVDTRKEQSIRDGIYILRMDGALLAKRLQRLLDGGILVKSDNPAYKELKAEKDQLQLLDIIGRVVWAGGII